MSFWLGYFVSYPAFGGIFIYDNLPSWGIPTDSNWVTFALLAVLIGGGYLAHTAIKKFIPGVQDYFAYPWDGDELEERLRGRQGLTKVIAYSSIDVAYAVMFWWVLAKYS